MRYIKFALLAVIGLMLIILLFANRQIVSLQLLPEGLDGFVGLNGMVGAVALPLYAVVLASVILGLVLGFFWEWAREYKHRRTATQALQGKATLEAEVKRMKARENEGRDPVLVMVEETAVAR